jgi:hypothetical protein
VISRLEEEIRQKDSIIRDQSDTINHYRFVYEVNLFRAVGCTYTTLHLKTSLPTPIS